MSTCAHNPCTQPNCPSGWAYNWAAGVCVKLPEKLAPTDLSETRKAVAAIVSEWEGLRFSQGGGLYAPDRDIRALSTIAKALLDIINYLETHK